MVGVVNPYPFSKPRRPQEIKLIGDVKPLGTNELSIKYEYSDITVGAQIEETYLDSTVKTLNDKEPGKGDLFRKEWFTARKTKYEPKFVEIFNRWGPRVGLSGTNDSTGSPVTVLVKTIFIEPMSKADKARQPHYITAEVIFLDSNNERMFYYRLKDIYGASIQACYGAISHWAMKTLTKELKKFEK